MINRSKMRRQLYRGGGIAGLYPRQKYGIGSWVKERVRKLIPNELADVATKAAPFVAPFNPGIAALMRGVGRFDQRGSISDALKQGALTYGGGQLARQLGGAGFQTDFLGTPGDRFRDRFTSPLGEDTGLGKWLDSRRTTPAEDKRTYKSFDPGEYGNQSKGLGEFEGIPITQAVKETEPSSLKSIWDRWQDMDPGVRTAIVGVGSGALAGVAQWFENQIPQEPGESMDEYLARRKVAVGKLMRQYMDNTRAYDAAWTTMTDEQKDAEVAKFNMNQGGRVGYQAGNLVDPRMNRSLAENIAANEAQNQRNQLVANASALASKIGTGIKSLPEKAVSSVFGKHFDNTQNLRNALSNKMITEDQYKKMSGYDASREIAGLQGINPGVTVFNNALASGLYNAYKKYRNFKDPSNPDAQYSEDFGPIKSIIANAQGSIGLPEDQLALYNQIIGGQTQQSELDRFKTAWDMANYGMPSEQVNWTTTARPDYERILKNYQTWNQGPWSSDPSITSKITSSFGHAPGYMLASGGRVGLRHGTPEEGIKSLDAGAMDITYEGNEGPQAPMKMAFDDTPSFELEDLKLLIDEFKEDNNGQGPVSIDELRRHFYIKYGKDRISKIDKIISNKQMASAVTGGEERDIAGEMWMRLDKQTQSDYGSFENYFKSGDWIEGVKQIDPGMSRGPILPEDPTKPINPFAPKPTGPALPDKMMAAQGGRIGQLYGTGPAGLPGIPRMAPDGMEFDMRMNGGFQGLGAKEGKDDVPAMLAKNEFVFTADAVRGAGGGDIELGAQRMYDTMKNLEKRVV